MARDYESNDLAGAAYLADDGDYDDGPTWAEVVDDHRFNPAPYCGKCSGPCVMEDDGRER